MFPLSHPHGHENQPLGIRVIPGHSGVKSFPCESLIWGTNIWYYVVTIVVLWWWHLTYNMGVCQNLLLSMLVGWTPIYQLFWCSPGLQGFDPKPYTYEYMLNRPCKKCTKLKVWYQLKNHLHCILSGLDIFFKIFWISTSWLLGQSGIRNNLDCFPTHRLNIMDFLFDFAMA